RRAASRGGPVVGDRRRRVGRGLGARSVRSYRQRSAVHGDRARRRGAVPPRRARHRGTRRAPPRRGAGGARPRARQCRGRRMRRVLTLLLLAALALPLAVVAMSDPASAGETKPKAQRVLVISLPAVTWQDIQARKDKLPNLIHLLDSSAIGGLTTRAIDRKTTLADGYVTLGAGTRSVGTETNTDGEGFEVGEPFGNVTAGQVFERRTDRDPRSGLVNLGIAGIVDKNKQELYDAEVGALGDKLASAGWSRAVIANGDGYDPEELPVGGYYRRQAVAGLMGSAGEVPAGAVGPELLVPDAQAPFGLRYDNAAVL